MNGEINELISVFSLLLLKFDAKESLIRDRSSVLRKSTRYDEWMRGERVKADVRSGEETIFPRNVRTTDCQGLPYRSQ